MPTLPGIITDRCLDNVSKLNKPTIYYVHNLMKNYVSNEENLKDYNFKNGENT